MTGFPAPGQVGSRGGRLGYLDWARGLAVLVMIHTHAFYSWVRPEDRGTRLFGLTRLIGGYPAALFLFLAGVATALVAEREREKGTAGADVLRRALRRGLTVLGYAFLFRVAMLASGSFGRPADLLRVDVLNCIAVSLLLVSLTTVPGTAGGRIAASLLLAAAVALATPLAWDGSWWRGWPPALTGYVTGRVPDALFPVMPWATFAALGAACGGILGRARARGREGITIATLAAVGAAAIPAALLLDRHLPATYPAYDFWFTSPAYVTLKAGVVLVALGAAYVLDKLPGQAWVRQLGVTSLFVYWLHLEVVYGQWIAPGARGTLAIEKAVWGVAALVGAMVAASYARTSVDAWRRRRRERRDAARVTPSAADERVRRPA
jgi:uncharacterized membrane protein